MLTAYRAECLRIHLTNDIYIYNRIFVAVRVRLNVLYFTTVSVHKVHSILFISSLQLSVVYCHSLFLSSSSFGTSERLYFGLVAFPGNFIYILTQKVLIDLIELKYGRFLKRGKYSDNVIL